MLRIKDLGFWEAPRKRYEERLREVESKPPRWETFDFYGRRRPWVDLEITPDMQMDRLWDSVKDLDLTWRYVHDLIEHGRRTEELDLVGRLEEIEIQVDEIISLIYPPWKKSKQLNNVTENRRRLKEAMKKLEAALEAFKLIYIDVSLKLEARRGGWIETTPNIYRHLRDAAYGLRKWLEWDKQHALKSEDLEPK